MPRRVRVSVVGVDALATAEEVYALPIVARGLSCCASRGVTGFNMPPPLGPAARRPCAALRARARAPSKRPRRPATCLPLPRAHTNTLRTPLDSLRPPSRAGGCTTAANRRSRSIGEAQDQPLAVARPPGAPRLLPDRRGGGARRRTPPRRAHADDERGHQRGDPRRRRRRGYNMGAAGGEGAGRRARALPVAPRGDRRRRRRRAAV